MAKGKRRKRKTNRYSSKKCVKTAGNLALVGVGTAVAVNALRSM